MKLDDLLRDFRATHPVRIVPSGGADWECIAGETGLSTVVILGGGGSTAESMFTVHAALESEARVISLGIPTTAGDVDQVNDGILGVLEALEVQQAVILGHSLGGMIAQAFAARHPRRVAGLVLSNSAIYLGARAKLLPAAASLMSVMPAPLLIRMVTRQMDRLLRPVDQAEFWIRFFREDLSAPGAGKRVKHSFALLSRFAVRLRALAISQVPARIVGSEDDQGFTRAEIAYVGRLYPDSTTSMFPAGTGHLSFLTRPEEYCAIVRQFVSGLRGRSVAG